MISRSPIYLITLPQWNPTHPTLALPMLGAYLRRNNVEVVMRDFNIEFYHWLLDEERLKILCRLAPEVPEIFTGEDWGDIRNQVSLLYAIENISESIAYLCDPANGSYDLHEYAHTRMVIETCLQALTCQSNGAIHFNWNGLRIVDDHRIGSGLLNTERSFLTEYLDDWVVPQLAEKQPNILGISVLSYAQFLLALALCRRMKELYPDLFIVVGGGLLSNLKHTLLTKQDLHKWVNAYVLYEGEGPLLELVQAVENREVLDTISNLIFYNGSTIVQTPLSEDFVSLHDVGCPDFDDFDLNLYFSPHPIIPLLTYRGCYWGKCAFCTHHMTYAKADSWTGDKSIVDALIELKHKHNTAIFYFVDECIPISHVKCIHEGLKQNEELIRWYASARLDGVFTLQENIDLLVDSGCELLIFGLESANDRVLDAMHKGSCARDSRLVLQKLHDAGIKTSTMQFLGFPTESEQEANDTLSFLKENKRYIDLGADTVGLFNLNENSPIHLYPQAFGVQLVEVDRAEDSLYVHFDYKVNNGMDSKRAAALVQKFNEQYYHTLDSVFHLIDRAHAMFVGLDDTDKEHWNQQMFSSAVIPMDQRLRQTDFTKLKARLAPGVVIVKGKIFDDRPSMLLINLISQRMFKLEDRLKHLLRELKRGVIPRMPSLNLVDVEWTRDAIDFLKNEGFIYLSSVKE